MSFVRRHVTRRPKTAKADRDKELRRVINNITAFFEERLRDGEQERDIDRDYRDRDRDFDRDSQYGDAEPLREAFVYHSSDPRPASQADTYSDCGYALEQERSHSRRHALPEDDSTKFPSPSHHPVSLQHHTLPSVPPYEGKAICHGRN